MNVRFVFQNLTLLLFGVLQFLCVHLRAEEFHEELLLRPLGGSYIYSHFEFTTLWNNNADYETFKHCRLFPLSLAEIIKKFHVNDLHVTLTQGVWRYEKWGYPVSPAASGAEVWVEFGKDTKDIEKAWSGLVNALSGLLCASFNFISRTNTISPKWTFYSRPLDPMLNGSFVKYASLPHEVVCTENLTPWKKLLPCSSTGLVELLNAKQLHSGYHSLGLHFKTLCLNDECTVNGIQLKQALSLVHDLMILPGHVRSWGLGKLFGRYIKQSCSLASTSRIYLDVNPSIETRMKIFPDTQKVSFKDDNYVSDYIVYDNKKEQTRFQVELFPELFVETTVPPVLTANRYIAGYGQEYGRIITEICNRGDRPLVVTYLDHIPWFLPIYYHTLRIESNIGEIIPLKIEYIPGKMRVRPYYLEIVFEAPEFSVTEISFEFEYSYLKWQEYPPDANLGFFVGPAIVSALIPKDTSYRVLPFVVEKSNVTDFFIQLRTEVLIVTLPTPDFSMPYNVICLACTVVALAFGPLHNITTKKLKFIRKKETNHLQKVVQQFRNSISRVPKKLYLVCVICLPLIVYFLYMNGISQDVLNLKKYF